MDDLELVNHYKIIFCFFLPFVPILPLCFFFDFARLLQNWQLLRGYNGDKDGIP